MERTLTQPHNASRAQKPPAKDASKPVVEATAQILTHAEGSIWRGASAVRQNALTVHNGCYARIRPAAGGHGPGARSRAALPRVMTRWLAWRWSPGAGIGVTGCGPGSQNEPLPLFTCRTCGQPVTAKATETPLLPPAWGWRAWREPGSANAHRQLCGQ